MTRRQHERDGEAREMKEVERWRVAGGWRESMKEMTAQGWVRVVLLHVRMGMACTGEV